jgi:hypothetical protein
LGVDEAAGAGAAGCWPIPSLITPYPSLHVSLCKYYYVPIPRSRVVGAESNVCEKALLPTILLSLAYNMRARVS